MCNCNPGEDDAARCYPSSLTDEVWSVIEPLLPVRDQRKGGRPRKYGDRLVLDSIFYVLATLGFRNEACSAQYISHCTRTHSATCRSSRRASRKSKSGFPPMRPLS